MKTWIVTILGSLLWLAACGSDEVGPAKPAGDPRCGDAHRSGDEVCDGADLAGASCESIGFSAGTLGCKDACDDFDRTNCGAPESCGDDKVEAPEICDGADLAGGSCESLGHDPGVLSCLANCGEFDVSRCVGPTGCGDGLLTSPEVCDGELLGGQACSDFGHSQGSLTCADDCKAVDASACCDAAPFTADRVLDLDVQVIKVTGQVTLAGQAMPGDGLIDGEARAKLIFIDSKGGGKTEVALGETGPAAYEVALIASRYDVYLEASPISQQDVLPGRQVKRVAKELELGADGSHDFDVKLVTVSGEVKVNGQTMADDGRLNGTGRGVVIFRDQDSERINYVPLRADLGETGSGTYSALIFASTYDVSLRSPSWGWQDALPPDQEVQIRTGASLAADATLDFDAKVVNISGEVLVNGQTMPNDGVLNGRARAQLDFRNLEGGYSFNRSLGETGPATYDFDVYAGSYRILLRTLSAPAEQDAFPGLVAAQLADKEQIVVDGVHNFDVGFGPVTGAVTINGSAMADDGDLDGNPRGVVTFQNVVGGAGWRHETSLGETGPAVFKTELFTGVYDVFITSSPGDEQNVLPSGQQSSGQRQYLAKALPIVAGSSHNLNIDVVRISGEVTSGGQTMPNDGIADGVGRALVLFSTDDSATEWTLIGETGPAKYDQLLFAGTYDILLIGRGLDASSNLRQDVLPSGHARQLVVGQNLKADAVMNFDVGVVQVSGEVRLNGQTMPDDGVLDGVGRGAIRFVFAPGSSSRIERAGSASFGEVGKATYSTKLFVSGYDVSLTTEGFSEQDVLPGDQLTQLLLGCE